jgi:hypothetical protein
MINLAEFGSRQPKRPPKNSEELRIFFNRGGVEGLAKPLDYLLADQVYDDAKVRIIDEKPEGSGDFVAYWQYGKEQSKSRLLVIQSTLSSIAGLYLNVPVELDSYQLGRGGSICASYSPRLAQGGHRIGHYLKNGNAMPIGDPAIAVRVQRIASRELLRACNVATVEELDLVDTPNLSLA